MVKLTDKTIPLIEVPEGARDVQVFDDELPGFGIRKFASGKATFFVKYAVGAQQRKLSLGPVVTGVVGETRKKAQDVLAKARLGQDVVAEKKAKAAKKIATVGTLVPKYLAARRDELGPRYYTEVDRYLRVYWEPIHGLAIEEVTRRDLVRLLDEIADQKGRVTSDRMKDAISSFFVWAIDKSYIEANPANAIKRRAQGGGRKRVLNEQEIAEVWHACRDDDHGRIVRLLILTGQRKSEIADLCWSEIDSGKKQINLPGNRTKNGLPHIVPVSDIALKIISEIAARQGRDFIFGEGGKGFQGWSKSKEQLDKRINTSRAEAGKKPIAPWTIHDVRRSFVTHLGEQKIAPPHIVESCVNHVSGHKAGVAGVYNQALYLDERREAFEAWGKYILSLVAGG